MTLQSFHAFTFQGRSYDCGDKVGYLRAFAAYALASQEGGADAVRALQEELVLAAGT
jgi:UTP--glucose-1-phosphate uridylyltransferase